MATRKPLVMVSGQLSELPAGDNLPLSWEHLVFWPSAEAGTATVSTQPGSVRSHTKAGVTVYRFIPNNGDLTLDAFYTTFTGGVLSGLICSRG